MYKLLFVYFSQDRLLPLDLPDSICRCQQSIVIAGQPIVVVTMNGKRILMGGVCYVIGLFTTLMWVSFNTLRSKRMTNTGLTLPLHCKHKTEVVPLKWVHATYTVHREHSITEKGRGSLLLFVNTFA